MYKVCYWDDQTATQQERDATPDEVAEIEARKTAPPTVPQSVTMRQARLALLSAGLLPSVTTAINAAGESAKIEWEYAQEVQRASGLVPAMATALGLTESQIDTLFIEASSL